MDCRPVPDTTLTSAPSSLASLNLNARQVPFPLSFNTDPNSSTLPQTGPINSNYPRNPSSDFASLDEMLGMNTVAPMGPTHPPSFHAQPQQLHHVNIDRASNLDLNMNVNMGITTANPNLSAIQNPLPLNPICNSVPNNFNATHAYDQKTSVAPAHLHPLPQQQHLVSSSMPPLPSHTRAQGNSTSAEAYRAKISRKRRHSESTASEITSTSATTTTTNSSAAVIVNTMPINNTATDKNNHDNNIDVESHNHSAPHLATSSESKAPMQQNSTYNGVPTSLPTKDELAIDQSMLLQIGGLSYAELYKERAREAFKEAKKNEYLANGNFDRMKRRKKNDTSMSAKEKYQRRLRMNQDSAAAARHAQEIYVLVLEKLVGTCEVERQKFLEEMCEIKSYNCQLKDKVGQLEEKVKILQSELSGKEQGRRVVDRRQKEEFREQTVCAQSRQNGETNDDERQQQLQQQPQTDVNDDLDKKLDPFLMKFLDMFKAPSADIPDHPDNGVLPAPAV